MVSVSAWYVLKKRNVDLAKSNLKLALPFFILFAFANLFIFGPNMAIEVTNNQPLKLASMEGLWQSTSCAPMFFLGWVDVATQTTTGLNIPCLLSFLAYQDIHATVAGIDSFAPAPTPPINLLFQVYHVMINLAPLLAGIGVPGGHLVPLEATHLPVAVRALAAGRCRCSWPRSPSPPAGGRPRSAVSRGWSTTSWRPPTVYRRC